MTQVEFCTQQGLDPKYLSLRRMKLKAAQQDTAFIQAKIAPADSTTVVIQYGR